MKEVTIQAERISHRYRGEDRAIPSPISFEFRRDEGFLHISGPNGVGKTTLVKMLTGEVAVSNGKLCVSDKYWSSFSCIFQKDGLFPNLTVEENLLAGRVPINKMNIAFAEYRLDNICQRTATQLSGGEERRVQIARCVFGDKPSWIADEPTASLDKQSTMDFARSCISHVVLGGAVIAVSHDGAWISEIFESLNSKGKFRALEVDK